MGKAYDFETSIQSVNLLSKFIEMHIVAGDDDKDGALLSETGKRVPFHRRNRKTLYVAVGIIGLAIIAIAVVCSVVLTKEKADQSSSDSSQLVDEADDGKELEPVLSWWKKSIVYQVYPRSFQDSNGDGIGDIRGITSRLDYFEYLGVDAIWISPVYKSPMADFGYDISDYTDIDPIFGSLADFKLLLHKAHRKGINIVMDFVPNHSSNQHPYFVASKQSKTNEYADFYVWHDGVACSNPPSPATKCPPNQWVSVFSGPMWTWAAERQQFYLHQFLPEQPDFNYRNPKVQEWAKETLRFWMDLGVDGFRIDAIPHLVEDDSWTENEFWPNCQNRSRYECMKPEHTINQPLTYDVVKSWTDMFAEYGKDHNKTIFSVTEAAVDADHLFKYQSDAHVTFSFNFNLLFGINQWTNSAHLRELIAGWIRDMPRGSWPNWVIGNHDQDRIGSKFGGGRKYITAFNALLLLLPGTPTAYQGDEIGMINGVIPESQRLDPLPYSRDPERTPMQWDSSKFSGFTSGEKTWLPVNPDYETINVEAEKKDKHSFLAKFQALLKLRKEPAFVDTSDDFRLTDVIDVTDNIFCFLRGNETTGIFAVLINIGKNGETETFSLAPFVNFEYSKGEVVFESLAGEASDKLPRVISTESISMQDAEVLVLKLTGGKAEPPTKPPQQNATDSWWEKTPVYQIYPRSFQDSDGDGIGDLDGITNRLDYIADLGVKAVWLSPIYKSPMKDFGYDIQDFRDIEPTFGTILKFRRLAKGLKDRGIKLIMDYVPNHSSDKHAAFMESRRAEANQYSEYYVWHNGTDCETTATKKCPPNSWVSVFTPSMWTWDDNRKAFYLHQFLAEQPDLNFRNLGVRKMMKEVLEFWLDEGVDGFRIDAILHLVEDANFTENEFWPNCDRTNYGCMKADHTTNQPLTYKVVKEWTDFFAAYGAEKNRSIFSVTEAATDTKHLFQYYTEGGVTFSFNFNLLGLDGQKNAADIRNMIAAWIREMPKGSWPNWVLGNHDQSRIATKIGGDGYVDAMNALLLLLPGTPTVYYGDELGMTDTEIPADRRQDPSPTSRDPERTPMQWSNDTLAGFTSGNSTWLPVNSNYATVNVEAEQLDPNSHLNKFKQLLRLRSCPGFAETVHEFTQQDVVDVHRDVLAIVRKQRLPDGSLGNQYVVLIGVGHENRTRVVNLHWLTGRQLAIPLFHSGNVKTAKFTIGMLVTAYGVEIEDGEAVVFQLFDKEPESDFFTGSFIDRSKRWTEELRDVTSESFKQQSKTYSDWVASSIASKFHCSGHVSAETTWIRPYTDVSSPSDVYLKVSFSVGFRKLDRDGGLDSAAILNVLTATATTNSFVINPVHDNPPDWWKRYPIYQIYPRSFQDSDGNGVGDLKGIISRIPYLVETGIKAVWLSPIYTSPMVDNGYDIADFTDIDPVFGTMEDFKDLVSIMRDNGMYVIMDYVPNHSSENCSWFVDSRANASNFFSDWYVWRDGKNCTILDDNTRVNCSPPNNWNSVFSHSAWTWAPERQKFYLHQFFPAQPDLNYRNPYVRAHMTNVLRFWMNHGVDGFRIDAISHLYEHPDFPDNPRNYDNNNPESFDYTFHTYNYDQPETVDEVHKWTESFRRFERDHPGRHIFSVVELYTSNEVLATYYNHAKVSFPFNMLLIGAVNQWTDANTLKNTINNFLQFGMPPGADYWPNWVLGNHDQKRFSYRLGGNAYTDIGNMLVLLLPGTATVYYGDEIGMVDPPIDHGDPLARDSARTPMQWDQSAFSGFTNGSETWIEMNDNNLTVNVAVEKQDPKSHLNVFKQILQLRLEQTFQMPERDLSIVDTGDTTVFAFLRGKNTATPHLVLLDFGHAGNTTTLNLAPGLSNAYAASGCQVSNDATVRIASGSVIETNNQAGQTISLSNLSISDAQGYVLRLSRSC